MKKNIWCLYVYTPKIPITTENLEIFYFEGKPSFDCMQFKLEKLNEKITDRVLLSESTQKILDGYYSSLYGKQYWIDEVEDGRIW